MLLVGPERKEKEGTRVGPSKANWAGRFPNGEKEEKAHAGLGAVMDWLGCWAWRSRERLKRAGLFTSQVLDVKARRAGRCVRERCARVAVACPRVAAACVFMWVQDQGVGDGMARPRPWWCGGWPWSRVAWRACSGAGRCVFVAAASRRSRGV